MARAGTLPSAYATYREPICSSCLYGKATRRPWRTKGTTQGTLKRTTYPGQCIAVDQSESPVPGLVAQLKGIPTKKRYTCATVFVDMYSDFSYVHFQYSTNAQETLEAKAAFERFAKSHGVEVKAYHADNGRFAEKAWQQDAEAKGQRLTYTGVNAHFQNGRAEKRIRDLQDMGRTQLIHAHRRWSDAISPYLWPYAMRTANAVLNTASFPKDGRSPTELFTGVPVTPNSTHAHTFRCPAYVLDNRMQAGHKIPKWAERSRVGVYLGPSWAHSKSVGLILSLTTGLVSPQYHVKYDDSFESVKRLKLSGSKWQYKCHFTSDPTFNPTTTVPANSTNEGGSSTNEGATHAAGTGQDQLPMAPLPVPLPMEPLAEAEHGNQGEEHLPLPIVDTVPYNQHAEQHDDLLPLPIVEPVVQETDATVRRSNRTRRPSRRLQESIESHLVQVMESTFLADDDPVTNEHPLVALAASNDPDILTLKQAMQAEDADKFRESMVQEFNDHCNKEHWAFVLRNSLPPGTKVLQSVWAMRRKRRIATGEVYKWKARLNVHGGQQVCTCPIDNPRLAYCPDGFCPGLSTGGHRGTSLHEDAKGIRVQRLQTR